ncbi:hypothetical protein M422DRAFT_48978 [Sphaerobolus stellatus SS14]|uniref:Uncharacterized protein n=1 Tax=Sphaerobolus stellatus (strain SS14) TaxID=990650 RepID=A0A0C9V1R8_SPHS4|nr:hypothetical protein M422DRAFT_48978 [Sphaerobolus stellatus SS14]
MQPGAKYNNSLSYEIITCPGAGNPKKLAIIMPALEELLFLVCCWATAHPAAIIAKKIISSKNKKRIQKDGEGQTPTCCYHHPRVTNLIGDLNQESNMVAIAEKVIGKQTPTCCYHHASYLPHRGPELREQYGRHIPEERGIRDQPGNSRAIGNRERPLGGSQITLVDPAPPEPASPNRSESTVLEAEQAPGQAERLRLLRFEGETTPY